MTDQNMIDVEVLTPVRYGDAEPAQVGDVISIDARQAVELAEIGAVRIIDETDASTYDEVRLFPGEGEQKPYRVFYYDLAGTLLRLGDFPTLDDADTAFEPISAEIRASAMAITDRLAAAERLAEERATEISRLTAASGSTAAPGANEPAGGTAGLQAPAIAEPKPVSVTMGRDELREIAREEGIVFDANDTKAELVSKISAGRLTARAAA